MPKLELKVNFLTGTDIKKAITEATELADKLNLAYVVFDFNGIKISVPQKADIENGVIAYQSNKSKVNKFIIVDSYNQGELTMNKSSDFLLMVAVIITITLLSFSLGYKLRMHHENQSLRSHREQNILNYDKFLRDKYLPYDQNKVKTTNKLLKLKDKG